MPRTYKRKKIQKYSQEDLENAIREVQNDGSTIYAAGLKYGIPTTTLFDKVKENHSLNVGRPLAIPLEEEQQLASGLRAMEKWGFGLSRTETLELVADYIDKNNLETIFKNNRPGPDWFINFRKRHQLSVKKPQPVEYARKKMTDPFVIYEYFEMLENTLAELNLFERPDLIWNMDETSLCLDPTRTKVVGAVNKASSRTTFGSGRENITVLAAASASGQKLSPLIIFKGKNVWNQWMATTDNYDFELAYAASSKGWMEGPIFLNYLERVLFPAFGEERPVLIIFDGHSTHVTLDVVHLAIQHGITILKLPPHKSHLLQPLDVAVFKSFKCKWDSKLVAWQRHNVGTKMPKNVFAQTFADTWQETSAEVIKNGFKKAGIHPFNAQVIPEDKFDPAALKRFKNKQFTQPKSLKKLCAEVLKELFCITDSAFDKQEESSPQQPEASTSAVSGFKEKTAPQQPEAGCALDFKIKCAPNRQKVDSSTKGNKNVTLLTNISRSGIQNRIFLGNEPSGLPKCLLKTREKYKPKPKVEIISNIKVSFEDLLLEKLKQDKKDDNPSKRKRVAKGAEVITAAKVLEEREKQLKESASKKSECKSVNKKKKSNLKEKPKSTAIPGTSGIKINKKQGKNKRNSSDSLTSISDTMSIYSDVDIDPYYDTVTDENWADDFDVEMQNLESDENSDVQKTSENTTRTKNKGIGKKSKGKEMKRVLTESNNIENVPHQKNNMAMLKYVNEKEIKTCTENDNTGKVDQDINVEKSEAVKKVYCISDPVLVRYYNRKKWTYYIGFIKNIIEKDGESQYCVDFLKTNKKPQLRFIQTKRVDYDVITELLIVKKIHLKRNMSNEKEYYLLNDCDKVYFKKNEI